VKIFEVKERGGEILHNSRSYPSPLNTTKDGNDDDGANVEHVWSRFHFLSIIHVKHLKLSCFRFAFGIRGSNRTHFLNMAIFSEDLDCLHF
jgi:hypothetical protein